ncbi:MAG: hypothetical protein ABIE46_01670 [Patescibacteria group bacterium]
MLFPRAFLFVIPPPQLAGGGDPGASSRNIKYKKIIKNHIYYSFILTFKRYCTLYIGVTNDLLNISFQHKLKQNYNSFTAKYNIDKLLYFEDYQYIQDFKRKTDEKME